MAVAVGIVGIVAVLVCIAWFVRGNGPWNEEGVERPSDDGGDRAAHQGHFGPADAGAEPQTPDP